MPERQKIDITPLLSQIEKAPDISEKLDDEQHYVDEQERKLIVKERIKTLRRKNKTLKQNNRERKKYAEWIFTFTVFWVFFVLVILAACGHQIIYLSDTVLVTLITTTTVNVLAFFTAVTLYLFNKDKST